MNAEKLPLCIGEKQHSAYGRQRLALTLFAAVCGLLVTGFSSSSTALDNTAAPAHTFSSGTQRTDLLELYTSEGCSSCPPAEAWFSQLLTHPQLWTRVVPIVFHVDYWDYLGWKDPFSTARSSERQRRYRQEGGVKSVYTPGFVLNGHEWRGWFNREPLPEQTAPAGLLVAQLTDGELTAKFDNPDTQREPLELHVAVLGFDLTTEITAGENRGKALTHQFVVLQQTSARSTNQAWALTVPEVESAAKKQAVVVWVTPAGKQSPIQATGGWLH